MSSIRTEIAEIIGIQPALAEGTVDYKVLESVEESGYTRQLIEYDAGGDRACKRYSRISREI